MSESSDISDDDLHEYSQILNHFVQILSFVSSINLKNKDEAQNSYQAIHITTLVFRDLLSRMHGVCTKDIDGLENRARIIFDRNREQLRQTGQWAL